MAKKKRRPPRKRFQTIDQVRTKVDRLEGHVTNWLSKSEQALAKVRKYRRELAYYQKRLQEMEAALITQAEEELGRPLRSVRLDQE